jgi:hypothetical protein
LPTGSRASSASRCRARAMPSIRWSPSCAAARRCWCSTTSSTSRRRRRSSTPCSAPARACASW